MYQLFCPLDQNEYLLHCPTPDQVSGWCPANLVSQGPVPCEVVWQFGLVQPVPLHGTYKPTDLLILPHQHPSK